ncbi:Clp protease [Cryobacterium sp. LW097]|uniref:Clp protease N-terminal domain-containing protein n=1 Tax=unclassified Cryobacterium TaxID=2649013 RepID=UPI000B4D081E|nr:MULTISPECIES: Clp protease N-terminal domain-containing protein [unclassified Cryobacterium]ASD21888.1 Clp protease [Cryobacterium sp. LW097]TFC53538.1 Clp protease [Cryobacterium sp. TMB3-1-2]TFC59237.1 Clp protease [Cryobacterium sp. TMB1-7]TFC69204.1 Clp protease [Cryobacterium sp. TMB3-15]TFC75998.1 Clp protease [Cryobacterium sp. TMB3-10]
MGIRQAIADIRMMNELFTTAEQEAAALGDEVPGAEHLLLAVLALPDDSARRAFATFDVTTADVRTAIVQTHALALQSVGVDAEAESPEPSPHAAPSPARTGPYRSAGSLQDVFQRAVALSKEGAGRGHELRSAHVVWAAAEVEHGTMSRALRQLGVDRTELQQAARQAVTGAAG